jgi:hypothetical protein
MAKRNVDKELTQFLDRHGYHHSRRKSAPAVRAAPPPPQPVGDPVELVHEAAAAIGPEGRFHDKVYVSALWNAVGGQLGMSLEDFKKWLVVQNQKGRLQLRRADLVGAMDLKQLRRSEIRDRGGLFDVVLDQSAGGPMAFRPAFSAAPVGARPALAAARSATSPSRAMEDPVALVRRTASEMDSEGRFGDKVYIAALWDAVGARLGMSLPDFKRWLIEQNRLGKLTLTRADLVGAMNRELLARSEIKDRGAIFNFVMDPNGFGF